MVCKRFNSQCLFMLAGTYMDNSGAHVCTKVPSTVLSALSTTVRAVSGSSSVLFKSLKWLFFWVLNPSYTALKVYSLLVLPSAKSASLNCQIFQCLCESQRVIPSFSLPRSSLNTYVFVLHLKDSQIPKPKINIYLLLLLAGILHTSIELKICT